MNKIIFEKDNIQRKLNNGVEGDIYYYKRNNELVLLKVFRRNIMLDDEVRHVSDETIENKKNKLEIISESPLFSDEVKLYDLVYDGDDNLIGYTMKIEDLQTASDINSTRKRIEILKLVRDKLELFNKNNIYIGDFNQNNIIVTKDGIKLCDLDNIKIENYDFDLPNIFTLTYLKNFKTPSLVDNYSFNLESICYVGRIYEPYLLVNVRKNGLPRKINTEKNRILFRKILENKNYNNEYLIDNTRKFL